jgi:membrane protease YdiL (CAAX protease family)
VVIRYSGRSIITYLKALALYWVSSILISHIILYLDPSFANVNDENIASLADQNYPLMTIGAVLLVPIVEETLYRGVVFGKLYQKNIPLAYCVSITVFSALHVVEYIGVYPSFKLLLCFLQYIPAGLFLAWSYVKSDTIWVPIFIHMTLNLIGMLAM